MPQLLGLEDLLVVKFGPINYDSFVHENALLGGELSKSRSVRAYSYT